MHNWNEIFHYNGGDLFWLHGQKHTRVKAGDRAGCLNQLGYRQVRYKGKDYKQHRVIYEMCVGPIPQGKVVDHIDGDKANNRIENLRLVTNQENLWNARKGSKNTSGVKGVCWNKRSQKWQAGIKLDNKSVHLGLYGSIEEAAKVVQDYRERVHGEYARHQ